MIISIAGPHFSAKGRTGTRRSVIKSKNKIRLERRLCGTPRGADRAKPFFKSGHAEQQFMKNSVLL